MAFARYSVRQTAWRIWKWEADYRGQTTSQGYSLTKRAARWAARGWLRSQGAASALALPHWAHSETVEAEHFERLS